jgi:hypothetical protein
MYTAGLLTDWFVHSSLSPRFYLSTFPSVIDPPHLFTSTSTNLSFVPLQSPLSLLPGESSTLPPRPTLTQQTSTSAAPRERCGCGSSHRGSALPSTCGVCSRRCCCRTASRTRAEARRRGEVYGAGGSGSQEGRKRGRRSILRYMYFFHVTESKRSCLDCAWSISLKLGNIA